MNPLKSLQQQGQAIWLDYIRRSLITSGELERMVEEDGLSGMTANPTIFEKAIDGSTDYDDSLHDLIESDPDASAKTLYEKLAVEDIQMVADILRPTYDKTEGLDGFVSLEVSPQIANNTAGTIAEARGLWGKVNRPNLMIKVPATPEGIPAIEALLAEGINVNITLMFSLLHYEAVANAYIRGLHHHPQPRQVASVASFFVSRIDTKVDRALEAVGTPEALALRGKIAIANAKMAYRRFREIFYGELFAPLRQKGARVQRPLWASTGTKNPSYSDVLYIEELIGPDTINTMPPATFDTFRDHGKVRLSLLEGLDEAAERLARLADLDIDLNSITEQLQVEGVDAFGKSLDQLITSIEKKRQIILSGEADRQTLSLGASQGKMEHRLQTWEKSHLLQRLWRKDFTVWSPQPVPEIADRLGWLNLPEVMLECLAPLQDFVQKIKDEGVNTVLLLGMGGSSLAPEVFQRTFGSAPGFPELLVLDSTHPDTIRAMESRLDLGRTMFLVSSKSGTTIESLSLFRYFWERIYQITNSPGRNFAAITDPASPLEQLANKNGFRHVFQAPSDIGGRYSALSVFGLLPAAIMGLDVSQLLHRAWVAAESNAFCVSESSNSSLALGATLGELANSKIDKLTLLTSHSLAAFPDWLEQLIAESTGKGGKGIVPIVNEHLLDPKFYGSDRLFVGLLLESDQTSDLEEQLSRFEAGGHPVVRIRLKEKADLGQEIFRWGMAVASAGAVLGINPFNQPDVELTKELAQEAMARAYIPRTKVEEISSSSPDALGSSMKAWLSEAREGDYIAIQAFLPASTATSSALQDLRLALGQSQGLATTCGYGPRFLHSTGQLHKGGPNTGLFLQLVDDPIEDIPVPQANFTFGTLIYAQALGDYLALRQRGRRIIRVNLGQDVAVGLRELRQIL
ncbi:MAG: bifunctional transaldolase/phosoglucose isomerase [Chloroflexi bacterium]|nr:bifunctional transaldolase/phosoglucose isomerase [Chloroflexota bacterium]